MQRRVQELDEDERIAVQDESSPTESEASEVSSADCVHHLDTLTYMPEADSLSKHRRGEFVLDAEHCKVRMAARILLCEG